MNLKTLLASGFVVDLPKQIPSKGVDNPPDIELLPGTLTTLGATAGGACLTWLVTIELELLSVLALELLEALELLLDVELVEE